MVKKADKVKDPRFRLEKNLHRKSIMLCTLKVPSSIRVAYDLQARWSPEAEQVLLHIGAELKPHKINMPMTPLRLALETIRASRSYVIDELFKISSHPFAHFSFDDHAAGVAEVEKRICLWLGGPLLQFLEAKEVGEAAIGMIHRLVDGGNFVVVEPSTASEKDFVLRRGLIFSEVDRLLAGQILFPDLPPLMREHDPASSERLVYTTRMMSFPKGRKLLDGSLSLTFTLQKVHGTGDTVLQVTGSRRCWSSAPVRQRGFKGFIHFPEDGRAYKVSFSHSEDSLNPSWYFPTYLEAFDTLKRMQISRQDFSEGAASNNSIQFVRASTPSQRKIGKGMPFYDLASAFNEVAAMLAPGGFEPYLKDQPNYRIASKMGFSSFERASIDPGEVTEFIRLTSLSSDTDAELDNENYVVRSMLDYLGVEQKDSKPKITPALLEKWRLLAGKVDRIGRRLCIISMDGEERDELRNFAARYLSLDPGRIEVANLPPNVHGPREELPGASGSHMDRFTARRGAWRLLAQDLKKKGVTEILIVAAKRYGERIDDPLNVPAAKFVFAAEGMSVQYLIPRTPEERKQPAENARFFQKVQSALRDLYWGQTGFVPLPDDIGATLAANRTNADAIYAISVLHHVRKGFNKPSASLLACTRLDMKTGFQEVAIFDGRNGDAPLQWMDYRDGLRKVASTPGQMFLKGRRDEQRRAAASAITKLLNHICERDPGATVFVDPVGGRLNTLWPWLQVENIRKPVFIDDPLAADARWDDLGIVVMNPQEAGHMMGLSEGNGVHSSPTEVLKRATDEEGFANYWYVDTNRSNTQLPRLSCYRKDRQGKDPFDGSVQFLMPRPTQVLVRKKGSDEDQRFFMAAFAMLMRKNHITYNDPTTFPSPLFQHQRLKRAMCRLTGAGTAMEFYIDDEEEDDETDGEP